MRRLRFSVVFLMMVSAVAALDMAVMRSLFRHATGTNQTLYLVPIDGTHSIPFATLALGVLPMASLLVLARSSRCQGSDVRARSPASGSGLRHSAGSRCCSSW